MWIKDCYFNSEKDCCTVTALTVFTFSYIFRLTRSVIGISFVVNFRVQSSPFKYFDISFPWKGEKPDWKVFCAAMQLFLDRTWFSLNLIKAIAARRWPLFFCLCCNCSSTTLFHTHISLWFVISHEMGPGELSDHGPPVQLHCLHRCCECGIQCWVGTWGALVHTDRRFGNWAKVLQKICLECVTERGTEKLS